MNPSINVQNAHLSSSKLKKKQIWIWPTKFKFFSCSVACCKNHQSSDCTLSKQDTSVETIKNKQLYPTEDTIPPEKLNLLCKFSKYYI